MTRRWMLNEGSALAGAQVGEGRKRKKGSKRPGVKRKTRGQLAEHKGPKVFSSLLDEVCLTLYNSGLLASSSSIQCLSKMWLEA